METGGSREGDGTVANSKVKNKIAGWLPDSRGKLTKMYMNNVEIEKRKAAGISSN